MKILIVILAVTCCLQVACGQCAEFDQLSYEIFEDIGVADLALRVCLEATEDCEVRLVTEGKTATGQSVLSVY